ncbi:MAG TPA: response regulator transcription factor [Actinomycetota bacterium]|nr:response regulator transcription factor [Actinomycetota bacterium]
MRILIVDDAAPLRLALRFRIEMGSCEVVGEATNGAEAIEMVEQLRPDVVIMDVNMPIMDGVEATRVITERWPEVRVVAFTSTDVTSEFRPILDAGASDYFLKSDWETLMKDLGC